MFGGGRSGLLNHRSVQHNRVPFTLRGYTTTSPPRPRQPGHALLENAARFVQLSFLPFFPFIPFIPFIPIFIVLNIFTILPILLVQPMLVTREESVFFSIVTIDRSFVR